MRAKPIDEFLQECTGWLEKIATAKQREEAAYAAINNVQIEKKAFRFAARGMGHIARAIGSLASAPGRLITRLGQKLVNWGSKKKAPAKTPAPNNTTKPATTEPAKPATTNTAEPAKPVTTEPAKPATTNTADPAKPATTKTTEQQAGQKQQQTNTTEQPGGSQQQGVQSGAGTEGAVAQPGTFQKAMPYALAGGVGLLAGRSMAPEPVYTSPAMMYNNMMYQQSLQSTSTAPNIY